MIHAQDNNNIYTPKKRKSAVSTYMTQGKEKKRQNESSEWDVWEVVSHSVPKVVLRIQKGTRL